MYGNQCFQNKIWNILCHAFLCCTKSIIYKATDLTVPICHTGHNTEQSKDILIFKMLSSAFLLPLVAYVILEHMLHAKLCGFIFSVEEKCHHSNAWLVAGNGDFFPMDQTYCGIKNTKN